MKTVSEHQKPPPLPQIDYSTATDRDLDMWLGDNVMKWIYRPPVPGKYIRWMYYDDVSNEWRNAPIYYDDFGDLDLMVTWEPSRNRDQADMCLSQYWDRWIISLRRFHDGGYWEASSGKISSDMRLSCEAATESRVRAELACAIALYEANS